MLAQSFLCLLVGGRRPLENQTFGQKVLCSPPCISLMNSPDNSDNTGRRRAIYIPKPWFAFKSQLARTITILITATTGTFYKCFPKFDSAFILWASQRSKWLNNLVSHCEGYHFLSSVRKTCRCKDNFTTNYTPSHSSALDEVDVSLLQSGLNFDALVVVTFNSFSTKCYWNR